MRVAKTMIVTVVVPMAMSMRMAGMVMAVMVVAAQI